MRVGEAFATGKVVLIDLTRGSPLSEVATNELDVQLSKLSDLLGRLAQRRPPRLNFTETMRELLRLAPNEVQQFLHPDLSAELSNMKALNDLVGLPLERIYSISYGDWISRAVRSLGPTPHIVEPEAASAAPSQELLQAVTLVGTVTGEHRLRLPDYFSLPDGGTKSWFTQMFADSASRPIIVIIDELDEGGWQLVDLLGALDGQRFAIAISPTLDIARLEYLGYEVVSRSIESFVRGYPSGHHEVAEGRRLLSRRRAQSGQVSGVQIVSNALSSSNSSEDGRFLKGYQPTWADITAKGFVRAGRTAHLLRACSFSAESKGQIVVLEGISGSGKSGSLMLLAKELTDQHQTVGWINRDTSKRLKDLRREVRDLELDVLIVDDIDIFGERASSLCDEFTRDGGPTLVAGIRASRMNVLRELDPNRVTVVHQPDTLSSDAVAELERALERYGLLGSLRRLSTVDRCKHIEKDLEADLLATLIKVVTGEQFRSRILSEVDELEADQRSIYLLVCFLSSVVYEEAATLDSDLFQMCSDQPPYARVRAAIDRLESCGLIRYDRTTSSGIRARHRAIAEVVTASLIRQERVHLLARTARYYANAARLSSKPTGARYRQVQRLMSHNVMIDLGLRLPEARAIYRALQKALHDDMHYWLQRGAYEAERGDLSDAANYLEQAKGCPGGEHDFKVVTQAARVALLRSTRHADDIELRERARHELRGLFVIGRKFASETPHTFAVMASEGVPWLHAHHAALPDASQIAQDLAAELDFGLSQCRSNAQLAEAVKRFRPQLRRLVSDQARFPLA